MKSAVTLARASSPGPPASALMGRGQKTEDRGGAGVEHQMDVRVELRDARSLADGHKWILCERRLPEVESVPLIARVERHDETVGGVCPREGIAVRGGREGLIAAGA